MSRGSGPRAALACDALGGGRESGPLNLIHRNKVPNPIAMRVSGRFDFPGGVSFKEAEAIIASRLGGSSIVALLFARRAMHAAT